MEYIPGRSVIPQLLVRRERWAGGYKTKGTPLVYPGQRVQPNQPVIRLDKWESVEAVPTVPLLHAIDSSLSDAARRGSEMIPAGLYGRVVDVTRRGGVIIESYAAVLQGAIGAGNQVAGMLTMWQLSSGSGGQPAIPPGAILTIPGPVNLALLRQAIVSGVTGVVASSISSRDLEGFLRVDLIKLINSADVELAQATLPPLTILLTEGLGTLAMPMRTVDLLRHYQGSIALLSGTTSVRQGIFPELVISLPANEVQPIWQPAQPDPALKVGVRVRVSSGEYEGAIGIVDYLFVHEQVFLSGIRARAAHVRLESGVLITVPLTLLETIN
jgi:hypothetical protein